LIELPTGTGKTDLVSIYIKGLIQAGSAECMLFLADKGSSPNRPSKPFKTS